MEGQYAPLLEAFRRGEVERDVRLQAAQGAIAPRALEQLGLLAALAEDPDAAVREAAESTLAKIPPARIAGHLARGDAPAEIKAFFLARGVAPAAAPAADLDAPLVDADGTDDDPEPATDAERASVLEQLAAMTVPEKVKAAMRGSREMRAVLIRDPNKLVALSVLSSPKITEPEVETIARMGTVAEDVLRTIARTRAWMKSYTVTLALVRNAKTPVAVSMPMLSRLTETDLRRLSTDRNVPEALRIAARRKIAQDGR